MGGNEKLSKAGFTIFTNALGNTGFVGAMTNGGAAAILAHESVLSRMTKENYPAAAAPTEAFYAPRKPLRMNDEGIEVLYQPKAHSGADSFVLFRGSDVVVTGDVMDTTRFPVIDIANGGSINGEIDALNKLIDLTIAPTPFIYKDVGTYVVPGHGRLCEQMEVVEYRDMVVVMRDRIADLIAKKKTLAEIKAARPGLPYETRYGAKTGQLDDRHVHRGGATRASRQVAAMKTEPLIALATPAAALRRAGAARPWRRPAGGAAGTPRAAAPVDITGYWVSVVTEDWRYRMVMPAKGDYQGVPLTPAARKIADSWDPAKEAASGEPCKAYGAPAILRVPGRLHITWQDDQTLKLETDAGQQTRLFHFGAWKSPGRSADAAGRFGRRVGRRRPRRHRRVDEGHDHQSQGRLPAQERRALQRERQPDRVLRGGRRSPTDRRCSWSPSRRPTRTTCACRS